ncbi:GNAT superfamily N-acetyltransferase [Actinoplanes octamycinicus]|uniref:GNAT superfamily N-acetyltransferase n=1 Tax=Actinoplanes octamycinicus TaxID=135948 RepID=A0A7W7H0D7_9ACTN|nr:GNAT family N-acetyltransferase [Actinoplanes octamycinicus]MBB4741623.1 GNAT superfamily N-acetyltransferase [Actinoplanes octamycinicus]
MDSEKVLALFDQQMRREARPDGPSARIERDDRVVRHVGADGDWNAVLWSRLDEDTADAAIAEQVRYFGARGAEFEWKLYDYDRPADLGDRLLAAGFVPEEPETLVVAEVRDLDLAVTWPDGVRLEPVTDEAGVDLMVRAAEEAFGESRDWLRHQVLKKLAEDPEHIRVFVVMAGDRPVCSARMELNEGTAFASLWGGGTVHDWRGRGIYRALVAHRARIAAQLGYEYLQVDASDQSRPILQRLGFTALGVTTPYTKAAG